METATEVENQQIDTLRLRKKISGTTILCLKFLYDGSESLLLATDTMKIVFEDLTILGMTPELLEVEIAKNRYEKASYERAEELFKVPTKRAIREGNTSKLKVFNITQGDIKSEAILAFGGGVDWVNYFSVREPMTNEDLLCAVTLAMIKSEIDSVERIQRATNIAESEKWKYIKDIVTNGVGIVLYATKDLLPINGETRCNGCALYYNFCTCFTGRTPVFLYKVRPSYNVAMQKKTQETASTSSSLVQRCGTAIKRTITGAVRGSHLPTDDSMVTLTAKQFISKNLSYLEQYEILDFEHEQPYFLLSLIKDNFSIFGTGENFAFNQIRKQDFERASKSGLVSYTQQQISDLGYGIIRDTFNEEVRQRRTSFRTINARMEARILVAGEDRTIHLTRPRWFEAPINFFRCTKDWVLSRLFPSPPKCSVGPTYDWPSEF